MNLTSLFLRWVARSADALVSFIVELDAKLDAFLLKHDADVAAFEQEIEDAFEDAERIVEEVHAAASERAAAIKNKIDEANKAATILKGLKQALPTGN